VYKLLMSLVSRGLDAELAHRVGFFLLRLVLTPAPVRNLVAGRSRPSPSCAVEVMGLRLRSPLGLAAGFDKNAVGLRALAALGFGFVEIGTVTARQQPGNAKPRLARLPRDQALVNRLGFNNDGAAAVARRLARAEGTSWRRDLVVGVNIGRSRAVSTEEATDDYCRSARLLARHADYLVINISSPNTPGLRDLHAADLLRPLLQQVREVSAETRAAAGLAPVPLLVKVSPDQADEDLLRVADVALELGLAGIIATNTTVSREGLLSTPAEVAAAGEGGLSGPPLAARALEVLRLLRSQVDGRLVLMSVGGIATPEDAVARLAAGASLIQTYTGFVYGGPAWPSRVNRLVAGQPGERR
jgi:dihydroorotate dehydrogenase